MPLAVYVRTIEYLTAPFVHHFLLAELIYVKQLPFVKGRYTVLENKHITTDYQDKNLQTNYHKLLFTGTLAETTGIFTAIKMAKRLHTEDASITLTIIGYAAQREVLARIIQEVEDNSFIRLIGGDNPVSHAKIEEAILESDYGFICYPPNKSTAGRIPTKFYEYGALGLRILALSNSSLMTEISNSDLGLVFNEAENSRSLLTRMINFNTQSKQKNHFFWKNEESKLWSLFERL
jgi:glycosyltransferase involved in cell wall biosynthesis